MTEEFDGAAEPAEALPDSATSLSTEPAGSREDREDAELSALYDEINAPDDPDADRNSADQPDAAGAEPALQAIDAPSTWTAEMKARWASLPPDLREYTAQRESAAHGQISRMGQELSQLKPIGELRGQYQHVFDRNGFDFVDGFHELMAAQNLLEQDPLRGIAAIAETFGIDLHQVFGGQKPQGEAPASPEIQRLQHDISELKGVLTAQQRAQIAAETAEYRRRVGEASHEIARWSEGKEAAEALRPTMAALFKAGVAETLDQAYDMALAANPDIRQHVESARRQAAAAQARHEQEKAVAAARRASRTNGGGRNARSLPNGRWDDDANLARIYESVAGTP